MGLEIDPITTSQNTYFGKLAKMYHEGGVSPMSIPENLYQRDSDGHATAPSANVVALWPAVERFQREFARQNRSANTITEYGYDLTAFIGFLDMHGIAEWPSVDRQVIRDFLDELRLLNDLSPVTLNRRLACLRSFFKFLVEENIVSQNPAALVKKAKMPRNLTGHVYMNASEARQLLQAPDLEHPFARRDLAMLAVMLFCGLRVSEVSGLNIESIKREDMMLRVHGKGNKIRDIPLEPMVLRLLDDHIATRPSAKVKADVSTPPSVSPTSAAAKRKQVVREEHERNALFLSKNLTRITPRAIRMIVDKYMGAVELSDPSKHISPHKLRHTFATLLYLNGTDINALKELLGHADLSSTQIYAAVDKERKRDAISRHPLLP